jgi:hypothetical protein
MGAKFTGASGICAVKFHFAAKFRLKILRTRNSTPQDKCGGDGAQKAFCEGACRICGDKIYCGFDIPQSCVVFGSSNTPRLGVSKYISPHSWNARRRAVCGAEILQKCGAIKF